MALDQIANLEQRLARLEQALSVDGGGDVQLCASGNVFIQAGRKVLVSGGQGVEAQSSSCRINMAGNLEISASRCSISASMVDMNSAMVQCSGVMKANTVQANTVIGASYTPGAGNIW